MTRKQSHAKFKQHEQFKRDVDTAIATAGMTLAELGGAGRSKESSRLLARQLLKELEASLLFRPKAEPESVAEALVDIIKAGLRNSPNLVADEKENLGQRRKKLKNLLSACGDLQKALREIRSLDRLRPEGLEDRVFQADMDAAETRDFLSTPEIKGLVSRYGSIDGAMSALLKHLPRVATIGWIPWMVDQHLFAKQAQAAVLRAWVPLSNAAFGASRWDLLSAILSSKTMKRFGFLKTTRDALKQHARELGLTGGSRPRSTPVRLSSLGT